MASIGEINAETIDIVNPTEREVCQITINIGVFFDNSSGSIACSELSSAYHPEQNEENRVFRIRVQSITGPTLDELTDDEGMFSFGKRIGCKLYEVFNLLKNYLSGFLAYADNLIVRIDTFSFDEGFFCASLFCEGIEVGCHDNLPPYGEMALSYISEGGIIGDLKLRGAKIIHNSFSTFQTLVENNNSGNSNSLTEQKNNKKNISKVNKSLDQISSEDSLFDEDQQDYDNPEYIRSNENLSLFKLRVIKTHYEGLYSNLYKAEEWLENIALTADIVAVTCAATGIGLPVGGVCEVVSMGLNGVAALVCFGMAGMAAIDGDVELRNEHLKNAGWNTLGAIPFGSIIGKSMKGAKFTTHFDAVSMTSKNYGTQLPSNIIPLHPKSGPYLKSIENPSQKVLYNSTDNVANIKGQIQKAKLHKIEGKWLKQSNGTDIFVTSTVETDSHIVFNSLDDFSVNNNLKVGNSNCIGINSTPKLTAKSIGSVFNASESEKVQPISESNVLDFDLHRYQGQEHGIEVVETAKSGKNVAIHRFVGRIKWQCKLKYGSKQFTNEEIDYYLNVVNDQFSTNYTRKEFIKAFGIEVIQ